MAMGSDVATIHGLRKLHRGSCKSFDVMLESSVRVLFNQDRLYGELLTSRPSDNRLKDLDTLLIRERDRE